MRHGGSRNDPSLARLLWMASRWFDVTVREELARRGWPPISSAQALLLAHLDDGVVAPSELARRLGTSRQATHDLIKGLVALGFLEVGDDPHRRGGRLVCLTARGHDLAADAYGVLRELEAGLGEERMSTLRTILLELELDANDRR
jgi:DNA-binding MarR family transcriptional regulator